MHGDDDPRREKLAQTFRRFRVDGIVAANGDQQRIQARKRAQRRLVRNVAEIAEMGGARVWRVATDAELSGCDFTGIGTLGVTSGASTPEAFLERIRGELSRRFAALSG